MTQRSEEISLISSSSVLHNVRRRVVLTTDSMVSYVGSVGSLETWCGKEGILVELDTATHFSVWCPLLYVKELVVIPEGDELLRAAVHQ
jgi:hypothetical protein